MKTFKQALLDGFDAVDHSLVIHKGTFKEDRFVGQPEYFSFIFGDNNEYDLCFERLLWDNQWYVALYKNKELLTEKVVIRPGYEKSKL